MSSEEKKVTMEDKISELKEYISIYLKSRNESSSPITRELMWSRVGLCYVVFKELGLMTPEQLEDFFCNKD